jgi:hypothetical protein
LGGSRRNGGYRERHSGRAPGRRAVTTGIAATAAVAGYLLGSLAGLVPTLQPQHVTSPFYHYAAGDSLRAGLTAGDAAFLLLLAAAGVAAVIAFERRDLATPDPERRISP